MEVECPKHGKIKCYPIDIGGAVTLSGKKESFCPACYYDFIRENCCLVKTEKEIYPEELLT